MTDYVQVFTTVEKREDGVRITEEVVKKRVAACAQMVGPITSTYWWKGEIEQAEEWLCILKSRKDLYEKLETTIREIHPYDVPEILAVPVVAGNRSYLEWLDSSVRVG